MDTDRFFSRRDFTKAAIYAPLVTQSRETAARQPATDLRSRHDHLPVVIIDASSLRVEVAAVMQSPSAGEYAIYKSGDTGYRHLDEVHVWSELDNGHYFDSGGYANLPADSQLSLWLRRFPSGGGNPDDDSQPSVILRGSAAGRFELHIKRVIGQDPLGPRSRIFKRLNRRQYRYEHKGFPGLDYFTLYRWEISNIASGAGRDGYRFLAYFRQ